MPEVLAGQRLDRALSTLMPEVSRARIQRWVDAGRVTISGQPVTRRQSVEADQQIVVEPQFDVVVAPAAEPMALELLHEDAHIFVVNKPAGLVVHPGAGNQQGTLQNGLLHLDPALERVPRAGLVHRLDKDTSGALLVARTPQAHHLLTQALQRREIKRDYEAVAWGVMIAGGTVDARLARHPSDRTRFAVVGPHAQAGRSAVTHYRVQQRFAAHTLVSLSLETGRTHQIRVHMQHLGYPLVGDPAYGRRGLRAVGLSEPAHAAIAAFQRQALHARRLGFVHPVSGNEIAVGADRPADLQTLIDALSAS